MPEICGFIGADGKAKPMRLDNLQFQPARVRDKPAFDPSRRHNINFTFDGQQFMMRVRGLPGSEALRRARQAEEIALANSLKKNKNYDIKSEDKTVITYRKSSRSRLYAPLPATPRKPKKPAPIKEQTAKTAAEEKPKLAPLMGPPIKDAAAPAPAPAPMPRITQAPVSTASQARRVKDREYEPKVPCMHVAEILRERKRMQNSMW
ncbi:MAG: hypothetical protein LBD16_03500 [Oscillospiraceae bacterium]|jgi:hypothetical protein|nr:hypothetical protein [Oscillospiraceae bacterium]